MNFYFAGAIRGGRDDAEIYRNIIEFLQSRGTVLTEHVGDETLLQEEQSLSEKEIYDRDMRWLKEADLLIAEVSTPSLGVGYELAVAEKLNIPCLCLFRNNKNNSLSAMIAGNSFFKVIVYTSLKEVEKYISHSLQTFSDSKSQINPFS